MTCLFTAWLAVITADPASSSELGPSKDMTLSFGNILIPSVLREYMLGDKGEKTAFGRGDLLDMWLIGVDCNSLSVTASGESPSSSARAGIAITVVGVWKVASLVPEVETVLAREP